MIVHESLSTSLYLPNILFFPEELYTSEKHGSDTDGDGTESKPFKTILQAMRHAGKEPFPVIYVDSKDENQVSS